MTPTTAVVDFMTQNGPERTWVEVRQLGDHFALPPQTDNAPSTRHTLTFVGLETCAAYDYHIAFLDAASHPGPIQASGTFSTTCQ